MNKIYQAFDTIKLDEKVKKNVYQRLETKSKRSICSKLIYSIPFALAVLVFFISLSTNDIPQKGNDDNVDTFTATGSTINDDVIMYNGQKYSINDRSTIDVINANEKIGVLKQIDSDVKLANDFESYYHDGYEVYKSNNDNVLIVRFNDDVLIYNKQ